MKPYILSFVQCPGYLRARLQAETIDLETAQTFNREMAAKCDETGDKKLLVVREIPMMMDTLDIHVASAEFEKVMRGKRIAYVNPYEELREDFRFSVLVASNRGARMKVFNNFEDAEAWLLGTGS